MSTSIAATRKFAWTSMTVLASFVAVYAGALLIAPQIRPSFVRDIFAVLPVAISVHLAGGLVAIVVGAFQLNSRLRTRFLARHRWFGRLYVLAVVAGGTAGFVLALNSFGGLVTHFGFGLMAACWLGTTLNAYRHIRQRNIHLHRAWMLRSYAVTLGAVTLRLYLPLSQIYGIDFEAAYQAIAWLCWVPNLLIAEWFVISRLDPKIV